MNTFEKKLVDKLSHYHDAVPIYRIEPHSLDELERSAAQLANRVSRARRKAENRASCAETAAAIYCSLMVSAHAYITPRARSRSRRA